MSIGPCDVLQACAVAAATVHGGTASWEAISCERPTSTPSTTVVVPNTGYFGRRLVEMARVHWLRVAEVPVDVGAPVDVSRVGAVLPGADGVLAVHVETSTGVRHPVGQIARVAGEAGAVSVVNAISSAGGEHLSVQGMDIDALVTASQKGLEGAAGLGVLALGPRGRERLEAHSERPRSWYLDLRR